MLSGLAPLGLERFTAPVLATEQLIAAGVAMSAYWEANLVTLYLGPRARSTASQRDGGL